MEPVHLPDPRPEDIPAYEGLAPWANLCGDALPGTKQASLLPLAKTLRTDYSPRADRLFRATSYMALY